VEFFNEPLKIILLIDEGNERGDSINQQHYNDVSLDIPTYENIIWFIKKLYIFLFWSHVLFFKNCDFYNNIIMKSNQYLYSSSIFHTYKL